MRKDTLFLGTGLLDFIVVQYVGEVVLSGHRVVPSPPHPPLPPQALINDGGEGVHWM